MPALPLGRSSPQPGVQASHPTRQETESPPLALRGLALPEGRGTEEAWAQTPGQSQILQKLETDICGVRVPSQSKALNRGEELCG